MITLEQSALHARVVENRLRRDYRNYSVLVEIELAPEGFVLKSVAGDEDKAFSYKCVVPYDCGDCLIVSLDEVERKMREKMKGA